MVAAFTLVLLIGHGVPPKNATLRPRRGAAHIYFEIDVSDANIVRVVGLRGRVVFAISRWCGNPSHERSHTPTL
jgi:hypothetical protein